MTINKTPYRFLFAGGGTGGHLFPAVAVAQKIKELIPEADIMFIGTKSKIEGKVIPKLGYKFKSIWIKGFSRKLTLENILFPVKLIVSTIQSMFINLGFRPSVAIGSGGYVSGPAIFAASITGAKILLLEQNSYPGVTTRLLEKCANEVHVSFESSKKYLKNGNRIFVTGNPVRSDLQAIDKKEALEFFNLNPEKKTLLILGGSLGAGTINSALSKAAKKFEEENLNIIWQTGQYYFEKYKTYSSENIKVHAFIDDMNKAYSASELVVARAGATTIAELLVLGKPSILVPSPNVAENHQYYNAKAVADKEAAVLIEDKKINEALADEVLKLINDDNRLNEFSSNAKKISKPDAAEVIAKRAIQFAQAI